MRRTLILSLAGVLAFPALAQESKSADPKPAQTAAPAAAQASTDSALVQAARRSNRRNGKKGTIVITNDTLRSSKGHITTAAAQASLNVPEPKPGPEQELAEKQAKRAADKKRIEEARAEAERKAAEHRQKLRRDSAEQAEEGIYESLDADPAASEHAADATKDQKPPL